MAAPSSTVPAAESMRPSSDTANGCALAASLGGEVMSGGATVLQDAPLAVAVEAAGLMQEVPIVGIVCKTFLSLEQLVDTAKSNKEDLATLLDICGDGIKRVVDKRKSRTGELEEGFAKLGEHLRQAEEVAKRCSGDRPRQRIKRAILARKISRDIAAIKSDILAFCAVNTLVVADNTNVSCNCFQSSPST